VVKLVHSFVGAEFPCVPCPPLKRLNLLRTFARMLAYKLLQDHIKSTPITGRWTLDGGKLSLLHQLFRLKAEEGDSGFAEEELQ
jgi:hypothetical protein